MKSKITLSACLFCAIALFSGAMLTGLLASSQEAVVGDDLPAVAPSEDEALDLIDRVRQDREAKYGPPVAVIDITEGSVLTGDAALEQAAEQEARIAADEQRHAAMGNRAAADREYHLMLRGASPEESRQLFEQQVDLWQNMEQ